MDETQKRVIKKYPNRRLYDTAASCYITLADIKQLVLNKVDIQVLDAKTHEDITLTILLHIVLEEESLGQPLFTYEVLTQLIRFYGNAMQGMMGSYLEQHLQIFLQMQQQLLEQGQALYGKDFVGAKVQDLTNHYVEQNAKLLNLQSQWQEQAAQVWKHFAFNPFMATPSASAEQPAASAASKKKK
jgi:polyhydroxyalkanoate synthesis repressor PhaR